MTIIVSQDKNGAIGKNGDLLIKISNDMKNFRSHTIGKTVVMGRATMESLPGMKSLPERRNIVMTRTLKNAEGFELCRNIDELHDLIKNDNGDNIFVIGGGEIYKLLMPLCNKAIVTEIDYVFDNADTFIPIFSDLENWKEVNKSELMNENGIFYRFVEYERLW